MAKKQEIINLKNKNITYEENSISYQVLNLRKPKMTVELASFSNNTFLENKIIPFAHLPKRIKLIVKPN